MELDLLQFVPPRSACVVDFGCNREGRTGHSFCSIHPGVRYVGTVAATEKAETVRGRLDEVIVPATVVSEPEMLGLKPGEADALLYSQGVRVFAPDLSAFARQLAFLPSGGQVVICLRNPHAITAALRGESVVEFSVQEIRKALHEAGFSIYNEQTFAGEQVQQAARKPEIKASLDVLARSFAAKDAMVLLPEGWLICASKGMPRHMLLQALLGETIVTSRSRIEEPHAFCHTIPGVELITQAASEGRMVFASGTNPVDTDRVLVRARSSLSRESAPDLLREILRRKYLLVTEMDDDPERWEDMYAGEGQITFRACHAVQVSTEPLAEMMREYNPHVRVFPNQVRVLPPPRNYTDGGKLVLFFGAVNRENDWAPMMPVLNRVLKNYADRVQVRVVFDKAFYDALDFEDKVFFPLQPYDGYMKIMYSSDIAVLPLADNHFNRMKSDLKFIECASCGVAVLASPIVYEDTILDGCNGFIYHGWDEFSHQLIRLIEDARLRHAVAGAAYDYVKRERMLYQHYQERYEWYRELCQELPELNQELIGRLQRDAGMDLSALL